MCAACVAEGAVYVAGAVGTLRLMAARATIRRAETNLPAPPTADDIPVAGEPAATAS